MTSTGASYAFTRFGQAAFELYGKPCSLEVVDVPSRGEALQWAAKNAGACRCAQEVGEFMPDPTVGN